MSEEVTILGGGVAAAAAVLTFAELGTPVRVVAPTAESGDRVGEMLSSAAVPVLRELGLWDDFRSAGHRPSHATVSFWGSSRPLERSSMQSPYGPGFVLDRPAFEAFLWRRVLDTGSAIVERSVRRVEKVDGGWRLALDGASKSEDEIETRFLLDCTGRVAIAARRLGRPFRDDRLVAAFSFLHGDGPDRARSPDVLIEARPGGWWYSAPLPDGRLAIVYASDADLLPAGLHRDIAAWRARIEESEATRARIAGGGFAVVEPPRLTAAGTVGVERAAGPGWAAAGDAAMAFDPLSSHGLTAALWSGRRVAHAVRSFLVAGDPDPLDRYAEALSAGLARYRPAHRRIYAQERRFAEYPFWERRASKADGERTDS